MGEKGEKLGSKSEAPGLKTSSTGPGRLLGGGGGVRWLSVLSLFSQKTGTDGDQHGWPALSPPVGGGVLSSVQRRPWWILKVGAGCALRVPSAVATSSGTRSLVIAGSTTCRQRYFVTLEPNEKSRRKIGLLFWPSWGGGGGGCCSPLSKLLAPDREGGKTWVSGSPKRALYSRSMGRPSGRIIRPANSTPL